MGESERNSVAIGHAVDARANGQNGTLIVHYHVDDAGNRAADSVIGRTFPGDDMISSAADIIIDLRAIRFRERFAVNLGEVVEGQSSNGGLRLG